MSTISAGTSSGTALISTGNTDGTLQLQVNGTTPSVTLATTGAIGVGSTPGYGSSGQVLTSGGTGAAPTWATPATPASGLTLLSTVTASNSATVDVETTFSSTYDSYLLVATGVIAATSGTSFNCRFKIGGTYVTASYSYHSSITNSGNAAYAASVSQANSLIILTTVMGNEATDSLNFTMTVASPSSTTKSKGVYWIGQVSDASSSLKRITGAGDNSGTGALTGVRFLTGSGNITSGTFRLYGIANS
jgi:hypothetical protein